MNPTIKHPSAWIPIAMSLTVLASILIYMTLSGPLVREADEGTGAHLFQLWLVLEVLVIAFFALKWLPQRPKQAFFIIVTQIIAVLAACFPVFYFNL